MSWRSWIRTLWVPALAASLLSTWVALSHPRFEGPLGVLGVTASVVLLALCVYLAKKAASSDSDPNERVAFALLAGSLALATVNSDSREVAWALLIAALWLFAAIRSLTEYVRSRHDG